MALSGFALQIGVCFLLESLQYLPLSLFDLVFPHLGKRDNFFCDFNVALQKVDELGTFDAEEIRVIFLVSDGVVASRHIVQQVDFAKVAPTHHLLEDHALHFEVDFPLLHEIHLAGRLRFSPQRLCGAQLRRPQQHDGVHDEVGVSVLEKRDALDDSIVHRHRDFAAELQRKFFEDFFGLFVTEAALLLAVFDHFQHPLLQVARQ